MTSHEALKELFWFKCEKNMFDAIALGAMGAKQQNNYNKQNMTPCAGCQTKT